MTTKYVALAENDEVFDLHLGDDSSSDSVQDDREDEVDLDDDIHAAYVDDLIHMLASFREFDVVEVGEFSNVFDPDDDFAANAVVTYSDVEKEKLRDRLKKIWNKINRGEPHAKTLAAIRIRSDAAYIYKQ